MTNTSQGRLPPQFHPTLGYRLPPLKPGQRPQLPPANLRISGLDPAFDLNHRRVTYIRAHLAFLRWHLAFSRWYLTTRGLTRQQRVNAMRDVHRVCDRVRETISRLEEALQCE